MVKYFKFNDELNGSQEPYPILDSKLISPTIYENSYDIKLVECGEYVQVYIYDKKKVKNKKDKSSDVSLIIKDNNEVIEKNKKIEDRNIIRSKIECQRLAKANMRDWKTFITLTFSENITDIEFANKKFRYFIDKVRRVYSDFRYICIPEFQKRGAVHYHLLTNVDVDNNKLIFAQLDNYDFKHIKYWNDGFTSVETITGDIKKVIGYISKYMTKDLDDRLFGHHRYLYSTNLQKPISSYINMNDPIQKEFFQNKIQDREIIYNRDYINPYDNGNVSFLEYLKYYK